MSDFTGFPKATFTFLDGLATNNSKDWFEDNRSAYQDDVVEPTLSFIEALGPRIADIEPGYTAKPKLNGSFRRLNRDVRFSKDKTPYAPRIHMIFWSGDHPNKAPAFHLVLHARHYGFGAGQWQWTPDALERYRTLVQQEGARAALEAALSTAEKVGCRRDEPPLKRPAGGVSPDDPAAEHLRHKALVVRTLENQPFPKSLHSAAFLDDSVELLTALSPINIWLKDRL